MKLNYLFILLTLVSIASCRPAKKESQSDDKTEISINVMNRYINLPVSQAAGLAKMTFSADGLVLKGNIKINSLEVHELQSIW